MAVGEFNVTRNAVIKAKDIAPEVVEWFNDLQADYKKFFNLLFDLSGIPYGFEGTDTNEYVSPEQAAEYRSLFIKDVALESKTKQFIERLLEGGATASSCYSIFCETYKPTGKAKKTPASILFLNSIQSLDDKELQNKLKSKPQYLKIPIERWRAIGSRIAAGADADLIWDEISSEIANDNTVGIVVRDGLKIRCSRPNDVGYCRILIEMVGRSLRSCFEKNKEHQIVTTELKDELNGLVPSASHFELLKQFAEELDAIGSGLSKGVLFQSVKYIKNGDTTSTPIAAQIDVLRKPQFAPLLTAKPAELKKAYVAWKLDRQIARRKIYPFRPKLKTDFKIPVGQTGLGGGFTINVTPREIVVGIKGLGNIVCHHSHYLHGLEATPNKSGYSVRFRHKLKSKNMPERYWGETVGEVKEIGISTKNGAYTVSLPYTISHSKTVQKIQNFFRKANPTAEDVAALPDEIKVAAFDLNINNPVCGTIGSIWKTSEDNGVLTALDYGIGDILVEPKIYAGNGPRYQKIQRLASYCRRCVRVIREYKICLHQGRPLSEETALWLASVPAVADNPRVQIQSWVTKLRKELNKYKKLLFAEGYRNLGETIQLLNAMDAYKSLLDSYTRIHLRPGQQLRKVSEFDESRANFRNHISRRIASAIAIAATGCDVVFIEDLNTKFDSDLENNSLGRLFSANTLKKYIEMALEKRGIALVEVAKEGTSKTDPVTGRVCGRNTKNGNKQKAFVERNGEFGWIDSDLAASLNVLIRGLNHSVCPYKVYVDGNGEIRQGQRNKRYFSQKYGTSKPAFTESKGVVMVHKALPKKHERLKNAYIYFYSGYPVLESTHRAEEERLKHLGVVNTDAKQFAVTPAEDTICNNFLL